MERRFYNKNGDCVFVGNNYNNNVERLLAYMWDKYILKADYIKKVKTSLYNSEQAKIEFEFLDDTKEVFDGIATQWGQLDFVNMKKGE